MSTSHSQPELLNSVAPNSVLKEHHCQQEILETYKSQEKHDKQTQHRLSPR